MQILLVEDDESIREAFKMVLETEQPLEGLVVEAVASGAAAIEQVKVKLPDLILLDLTLVGEDSFDIFRRIRELPGAAELPIVAVTAHSAAALESQCLALGFTGFVTKPVDFDTKLFPLLRRLLADKTRSPDYAA